MHSGLGSNLNERMFLLLVVCPNAQVLNKKVWSDFVERKGATVDSCHEVVEVKTVSNRYSYGPIPAKN